MRLLYTVLLYLAWPWIWCRLRWRAWRFPMYQEAWLERSGHYEKNNDNARPLIWLHAVSVGETYAAKPLIDRLMAQYPQHRLLLTQMTPTGRVAAKALLGDSACIHYLPYDYPDAVRRFFVHFKPQVGILMETEIWPNLIHEAHCRQIPMYLVNARLSWRSYRRYQIVGRLLSQTLAQLSAVAAQSEEDAQRLIAMGANQVSICGNLKFDVKTPCDVTLQAKELQDLFQGVNAPMVQGGEAQQESAPSKAPRFVWLVASSREGEEKLLLEEGAHLFANVLPENNSLLPHEKALRSGLLVIVPRHPQRFDEVATLLERYHIAYQRRSDRQPIRDSTQVVLGDTMGEMFAYYAASDVAFIGGSLLSHGGQNLIEASAMGKPVLIGPHTFNFSKVAENAIAMGAANRVKDAKALVLAVKNIMKDPQKRSAMSLAASQFSQAHRGATEKILHVLRF